SPRSDRPQASAERRSQRQDQLLTTTPPNAINIRWPSSSVVALHNDNPFAASPPLTHEQLRAAVTIRRVRYLTLGYEPIPIISGRKRPALDGWQEVKLNLDTIRTWGDARPGELSTGIRTRFTPSFDIDIRDAGMTDQIQQVLLNLLPQGTILKRTGQVLPRGCMVRYREWYGMRPGEPNVGLKLHAEEGGKGILEREQ